MLTQEQREAIRARYEAARPESWKEWKVKRGSGCHARHLVVEDAGEGAGRTIADVYEGLGAAKFIAHAIDDIPALLDALEEAEADRDGAERGFQSELGMRQQAEADNRCLKARAEALERAVRIHAPCASCVHTNMTSQDEPCITCLGRDMNWQFDEARFSAKEGE